jgi:hypothetical protein
VQNNPIIFFIIFLFSAFSVSAQTLEPDVYVQPFDDFVVPDTTVIHNQIFHTPSETIITTDTIIPGTNFIDNSNVSSNADFRPDSEKVLWLGAVIPGFGQIVNRKYWKLPFVYGTFMGCGFAISWLSSEYNFYRIAHRDMLSDDPSQRSHLDYLIARGINIETFDMDWYQRNLLSQRDRYRRYRDLSILVSVAVYGFWILDAYVDAQLYDFDISPDLSMRIEPTIINNDVLQRNTLNEYDAFAQTRVLGNQNAIGIQWSIRLK